MKDMELIWLPCLRVGSWQSSDFGLSVCSLFPVALQDCVADQGFATQCLKYGRNFYKFHNQTAAKLRLKNLSQLNLQICPVWLGL